MSEESKSIKRRKAIQKGEKQPEFTMSGDQITQFGVGVADPILKALREANEQIASLTTQLEDAHYNLDCANKRLKIAFIMIGERYD